MPTYEYRCKDCGQDLEVQQAFTDEPLTECPACHGQLKKKFGSVGIAFKGTGFYKNDSRGSSSSTTTPATTPSTTSGSESSTSSSDSTTSTSSSGSDSTSSSSSGSTPAPSAPASA